MTKMKAAIYCRLSQDDGSEGESGSIQTQKTLLAQYCKEKHIPVVDYYCDDGWSGTNFERPAFKKMIEDIELQKINMVIVKDLSRFGREYAQMGMYIEHYFEEKGVRFISVAENIDTANGADSLVLPFTNVVNSFIARQASTKTKAAHRARARSGMYMGGHAPFGYFKDPCDNHKLLVDPVAAEVVKRIFHMFAHGVGYVRMTKILREEHILNPQAYFNQTNPDYYKSDYWRQPFDWHATSIRSILKNNAYLGQVVFGKTKTKGFFDKTRVPVPEKDWIVVENTHEPLVSQELWDTVHKMMQSKRRENVSGGIQPFAGLVKCGDCGSALNASFDGQTMKYKNFSCWVYKNYGKERCTSHAIGWQTLNKLVLEDIRRNALAVQKGSQGYLEMLTAIKAEKNQGYADISRQKLEVAKRRMEELNRILNKLYEDMALEKISEARYEAMAMTYEEELVCQKEIMETVTAAMQARETACENVHQFMQIVQKYTDISEVNGYILNELIEKIVVHEKVVDDAGVKSQQVDIHYKFIGYVDMASWLGLESQEMA